MATTARPPEPAEELSRVVARLEACEALLGVQDLMHRYSHAIDYGDETAWVDCFLPDGVFDVQLRGRRLHGPYRGADELAAYIASHSRAPAAWHKHIVCVPRTTMTSATTANVDSFFTRLDVQGPDPFILAFGRYRDRLVRCADHRWRFHSRVAEIEGRSAAAGHTTARQRTEGTAT